MMHNKDVAKNFQGEVVNTACHIVNRVYFKPRTMKTAYKLQKGRKPNVKYFKIFGRNCFILKYRENVGKFDTRSDEGISFGYLSSSKAYRVFNKKTSKVMENVNVVIDETSTSTTQKEVDQLPKSTLPLAPESDKVEEDHSPPSTPNVSQSSNNHPVEDALEPTTPPPPVGHMEREPSSRIRLNHPLEAIFGNINELNLRKRIVDKYVANFMFYSCYLSQVEPTKVEEELQDESQVEVMHDELISFLFQDQKV